MFPPSIHESIVKARGLVGAKECNEPFFWFKDFLPRITKKFGIRPSFIIQKPGDLVFVPSNWWHSILNLTDTIAVTQNYACSVNFDTV